MNITNIEIKCSISNPKKIEVLLLAKDATFKGVDHQIDTYFNVTDGRLKLRQGNIENSLIQYSRPESKALKKSTVYLQKLPSDTNALKQILADTLGVKVVVDKMRKIYFIDNVKFHIDTLTDLGAFVEIESIDDSGNIAESRLREQCEHYIEYLDLDRSRFINQSYSDMILNLRNEES